MASSANPYGGGGGGGIGGKMRRRPTRFQSTPYDRPPTAAARTPDAVDGSNRWISKLVDPASRFLTGSASKLFSSVFRKSLPPRITASVSSPEEMCQEGEEEPVPQLMSAETPLDREQDEIIGERDLDETRDEREPDETRNEIKSVFEIEQLLSENTFTKEQFEHLSELLRARVVEPRLSEPTHINRGQVVEANIPHREHVAESSRKNVMFATPASTVIIPKEEVASPMELARAYMSSKSSKASPTTLRLRTPAFIERKPDVPNSTVLHASTRPPNSGAITPRPNSLLSDHTYPTPRSLGRTAISRMCRSPFVKSGGLSGSRYEAKFSPLDQPTGSTPGSKLALKRGSSALYDEIGSVGPIRRIRQKLYMTTPLKEYAPSLYKNFAPTHTSALNNHASTSTQKDRQLSKLDQRNDGSVCKDEIGDAETEPEHISVPLAPPRSTETAMKILDQLGKIAQSPKDKRSEKPSLEIKAPLSQKQDKPKVNFSKLTKYEGNSFKGNGVGVIGFVESSKTVKLVSDGTLSSAAVPKSTKPSFRMIVPEDFVDDDEEETNEKPEATVPVKNVFNKVESGTSKLRKESKLSEEKGSAASEAKDAHAPISKSALSSPPVGKTEGVLKFASPPTTSSIKFDSPSASVLPTASLDVLAKKDERPPSPIFNTGLKQQEEPETTLFSWASGNAVAKADSRLPTTEASDSERSSQKRKSEDAAKPNEPAAFSASPSSATPVPIKPVFAFGGSSSSGLSNGSTHSSPKFSLSAVPAATPATQPALTSSIMTGANISSPAPEIPKLPFVQFGANNAASSQMLAPPPSNDSSAKFFETNTVQPIAFGSSPNFSTACATAAAFQTTGSASGSNLTTPTTTAGLFSGNVAGHSISSITTNTPFVFGNSEKTTTPSVPTFGLGSSATTENVTTSSPSVAFLTSAPATPVSTSTGATTPASTSMTTPAVTFGGSGTTGAFTFGASSQPSSSSSQAALFTFGATSTNSGMGIFGFSASSSQNVNSSTSVPSSGSSQSSFAFGASPGSMFGTKPVQPESTGTQSNLLQSQSTSSQLSSPFSSAASSPATFGASSSGFSFSSAVSTSAAPASTSQPSLFGSGSSNPPSIFGTTTFGSNTSSAAFNFGQSSSTPSTSFAFGAQSSSPGFSFPASGSNSTAPSFGLSNSNANSSTVFRSVSPGGNNDQMSMEDSMVDDTNQVATPNPPVPVFGQAASPVPLFGAPSGAAPAPAFQFGAQASQSLFQPGSNLEFNAGNQFSGSGAGDKANRRIFKARRDNKPRRK